MNSLCLISILCVIASSLVLTDVEGAARAKRTATGKRWPRRQIPYYIDTDYAKVDKELIQRTIGVLEDSLSMNGQKCLEFVPREKEKSFIYFLDSDVCASHVGFNDGINEVKLSSPGCMSQGVILHEIMHSLGFDHEQSRHDRESYINVHMDNVNSEMQSNFDINPKSNNESNQDSPYDYYSILHYSSGTLQVHKNQYTITSKVPSLLKSDKIEFDSDVLSPIDIIQTQRFYKCKAAPIQSIRNYTLSQLDSLGDAYETFMNEVSKLNFDLDVANSYFKRSLKTCGSDHYWPLEYPIVEQHHELYQTVCLRKKGKNEACKFTIECEGDMECAKILLRNGVCRKPNSNALRVFARILSSKIKQFGGIFKKRWDNEVQSLRRIIKQ